MTGPPAPPQPCAGHPVTEDPLAADLPAGSPPSGATPTGATPTGATQDGDRWFATLEPALRAGLRAGLRRVPHGAGERVYRLGDPPSGLHVVLAGEVRLVNYPDIGKQALNIILRPGDWFGELSVIDGLPRPHDAICPHPATIGLVPLATVTALAALHPGFHRDLAILSAQRQRLALDMIGLLLGRDPAARLTRVLCHLAQAQPSSASAPAQGVALRLSQEDLAGIVGLSRQRLNHHLKALEARGLIRLTYGGLVVLPALAAATP